MLFSFSSRISHSWVPSSHQPLSPAALSLWGGEGDRNAENFNTAHSKMMSGLAPVSPASSVDLP